MDSESGAPAGQQITKETKDKVAHILEGILSNLSKHKDADLMKVNSGLTKVDMSKRAEETSTMSTQVAQVLKGFLDKLGSTKQADALANLFAAAAPSDVGCTYFGACGAGGEHPLDSQTKD